MRSLQESNLIVFWRQLLLVDIVLLSLSTQLSWTAEIKIRLDSEENSGYEKFPSQLNRQQRRYDDNNSYRTIQVDLESLNTKESIDRPNKRLVNSKQEEVEETVFEIIPEQEYVIADRGDANMGHMSHREHEENKNDDRHKNRVPTIHHTHRSRGKTSAKPSERPFPISNHNRGLVPQLWANYTSPTEAPAENVSCNTARFECWKRGGCRLALESYAMSCQVLVGDLDGRKLKKRFRGRRKLSEGFTELSHKERTCNTHCRYSLIALMSTHEGQRMMKCDCEGESFCEQSKATVAPCQEEVELATNPDTVVSCNSAQSICAADPACGKALELYNIECRAMFKGRKCNKRCHNIISILRRQKGAQKLETCYCDGTENYKCDRIKSNMAALCFKQPDEDILNNEIGVDRLKSKKSSASSLQNKLERILIIITVFVGLFVTYLSACINAMLSDFSPTPVQREALPSTNPDPLF